MQRFLNYLCFFLLTISFWGNILLGQQEYTASLPPAIPGASITDIPVSTEFPAPVPVSTGVPMVAPTTAAVPFSGSTYPVAQPFPPSAAAVPTGYPAEVAQPLQSAVAVIPTGFPAQLTQPATVVAPTGFPAGVTQPFPPTAEVDPTGYQAPGTPVTTYVPAATVGYPVSGASVTTYAPAATVGYPVSGAPVTTYAPAATVGYPVSGAPITTYAPAAVVAPSVVPALPVAPQTVSSLDKFDPDEPTAKAAVPSELKGIDTLGVDESGGNWLIKRMWWQKASDKIKKIEEVVDSIMDARMEFFEKRDTADTQLFDSFYLEVGFDQGKLEEVINFLIDELQEKKEKLASLSVEEREFIKTLKEEKKVLKQLKANIDAISKVDIAVDEAITQLIEQINYARSYKKKAREYHTQIGDILDDNKARDLFYEIEAAWQSIKAIEEYVLNDFSSHFDEVISIAEKQTEQIKKDLNELEKKGVGFKKQIKKFEKEAEEEIKKEEALVRQQELEAELQEIELQKLGWFETIISYFMVPIDWVSSFWIDSPVEEVQEIIIKEKEVKPEQEKDSELLAVPAE